MIWKLTRLMRMNSPIGSASPNSSRRGVMPITATRARCVTSSSVKNRPTCGTDARIGA